jgi:hypothetical protein
LLTYIARLMLPCLQRQPPELHSAEHCSHIRSVFSKLSADFHTHPLLDLSVLSGKAPSLLTSPTAATPAFLALSLILGVIFFMTFTMISLRHKMGKAGAVFDRPGMQRFSAWIGLFGFMMGSCATSSLLHRPNSHTQHRSLHIPRSASVVREVCAGL